MTIAGQHLVKGEGVTQNIKHLADLISTRHSVKLLSDRIQQFRMLVYDFDDVTHVALQLAQIYVTSNQISRLAFSS